jgi:serine O-acetyltransferase
MSDELIEKVKSKLSPEPAVSATVPDWSREEVRQFWDPGYKLLRAVRQYEKAKNIGGPLGWLLSKFWVLVHRFWSTVTQSEIHLGTQIGGGLRLPHPTGIIIHPTARIGPNCQIFHQVTLASTVVMGGHVDLGAGAKVIGPLTIGDHVEVGANSVVTKDVASGATVAGIPAKVLRPQ